MKLKAYYYVLILMLVLIYNINNTQGQYLHISSSTLIQMNGFSILSPPGTDWVYEVERDEKSIRFEDEGRNIMTGNLRWMIYITVYENEMKLSSTDSSVKNVMNEILSLEKKRILSNEVKKMYVLDTIYVTDKTIDGRKFSCIKYTTSENKVENQSGFISYTADYDGKNALYIYLPDNYLQSGVYYGFLISCIYGESEPSLSPILAVMKSFKIDGKK